MMAPPPISYRYGSINQDEKDGVLFADDVQGGRRCSSAAARWFRLVGAAAALFSVMVVLFLFGGMMTTAATMPAQLQSQSQQQQKQKANTNEKGTAVLGFLRIPSTNSSNNNNKPTHGKNVVSTSTSLNDIPFPRVDRAKFGSIPADKIVDPDLFHESLLPRSLGEQDTLSSSSSFLNVPFPTGAFWTNLVLKKATSDRGLSYPVMAYPYAYKWWDGGLQISYPPLRRLMDDISIRDIFNPDLALGSIEDISSRKVISFDPLSVTLRYDTDGTAATTTGGGGGEEDDDDISSNYWESYLVQGSPYVTVSYHRTTPVIKALSIFTSFTCMDDNNFGGACEEEGATGQSEPGATIILRGTMFRLRTQENLTWLITVSEPISLSYGKIRKTTVSATQQLSDVILRLALIPPPYKVSEELKASQFTRTYPDVESKTAVQRLVCHSGVYPTGGIVAWESSKSKMAKNAATVRFRYQTNMSTKSVVKGCSNQQQQELLMLALPHHAQVLPRKSMLISQDKFDVTYYSIKGAMVPVVGKEWEYEEPLTTIGFDSDETIQNAASLDDQTKKRILNQVQNDMSRVLPTLDENVYGFGKQIARLAQLANIANVLETKTIAATNTNNTTTATSGDTGNNGSSPLLTVSITKVLSKFLTSFLSGENEDKLVYDVNFGGIVSQNGLIDSMDDFGNGWYNDHLFHYGYFLYASAVLGKLNATFVAEYGPAVDALMLDVINSGDLPPTRSQTNLFPFTRHKSWYDGHSFASGLFPFADGKSMESSGESVNCYYGAYLWSTVRWGGDGETSTDSQQDAAERIDFARLLLAMEIRGVKTYWHMAKPNSGGVSNNKFHAADIYNPNFAKNLMVGNVGMMDVTVATWFGIEPLYVHMINFLPVTAITKELFDKSYVQEEFHTIIEPLYDNVEMAWKGYVVCDRALVNPTAAWQDALKLRSYELDQAISQSQVLYFASTIDGFEAPATTSDTIGSGEQQSMGGSTSGSENSASCAQNKACAALGLQGTCCPSPAGIFLRCCDSTSSKSNDSNSSQQHAKSEASPDNTTSSGLAWCETNTACAELGLTGLCCPASNGHNLECCN